MEKEPGSIWEWIKLYNPVEKRMQKVGVMVGVPIEGQNGEKLYNADYAICTGEFDEFNPELGKKIALGRALKARERRAKQRVVGNGVHLHYNHLDLESIFSDFCERCRHYYKDRLPAPRIVNFLFKS